MITFSKDRKFTYFASFDGDSQVISGSGQFYSYDIEETPIGSDCVISAYFALEDYKKRPYPIQLHLGFYGEGQQIGDEEGLILVLRVEKNGDVHTSVTDASSIPWETSYEITSNIGS